MSTALVHRRGSTARGVLSGVASAVIPGLGQLINGDRDKAIGVFAVAVVTSASFLGGLPLIGGIAGLVYAGTWIYGVADGYFTGRRKG
jgi:hypothetical protein